MSEISTCALCLQEGTLRESHIIPKFVGKWIKETGTGYLVSAEDGAKRVQDITKLHLLCGNCEEKFSKLEKYFADNIFFPFHNDKIRTFDYDENFEKFIISLSWRALKIIGEDFKEENPNSHLNSFVDKAEVHWREYLNGTEESIDKYENHLVFLDYVDDNKNSTIDPKFHWYTLHSVDFTIVTDDKRVFVYVKLPWMIFVTSIHPTSLDGWSGTIIKKNGKITNYQSINDGGFTQFLLDRASLALYSSSGPTPEVAQKRLIGVIKKDPKKFLESNTLRSMIVEKDLLRKKKMEKMPESVIGLVEEIIRPAIDNPNLDKAKNQFNKWSTRQIADKIADLSKEESDKLHISILATIRMSGILQKDEQFTFTSNSLWMTFMVTPHATKEYQQEKIVKELKRLRQQTDDKIPLAVFSFNPQRGFESGFLIPRNDETDNQ
ncbi:hypothetical protein [Candidatus Nitrosotenuis chungbukensis]|uniref:hypothetical protein n=1 Tax=Candidatus Nitrosotenuis chungbukensis TaxID=1353246 RepID=UPI0012FED8C1|nr:hypothetical protein [Candidatus Nitrosotenuis chungbukensis]